MTATKKPSRRVGRSDSETRVAILDATEQLMLTEGYAAVSTRRVAKEAGLKAPLVHYYFPKTDDLLLACYKRAAARNADKVETALSSSTPLTDLWKLSINPKHATLAVEFMALAHHREAIRSEMASSIEKTRAMQTVTIKRLLREAGIPEQGFPPGVASLVLIATTRALVMESALGISAVHAETARFVESRLAQLEGRPSRR